MTFPRATGARPDPPDSRDHLYMPVTVRSARLAPAIIDRRDLATPVGDQGSESSCVGWAMDGAMRMIRYLRFLTVEELSARWGYERAKERDPFPDIDKDGKPQEGTTLNAGCRVLLHDGICLNSLYPYFEYNVDCMDPRAPEDARTRRIAEYVRVTDWRTMRDAIWRIGAVLVVVKLHLGWVDPPEGDIIYKEGYKLEEDSHHAVTLEGYNDRRSFVIGRNSWGNTWGDNGYFKLPVEQLMEWYTDAWTIKL